MSVYMCVCVRVHVGVCMHACLYVCTCGCLCMYMYDCICMCAYVCMVPFMQMVLLTGTGDRREGEGDRLDQGHTPPFTTEMYVCLKWVILFIWGA